MGTFRWSYAGLVPAIAASAALSSAALAQTQAPASVLDAVSVTATRSPKAVNDIPGTVSVIDAEELERRNAQSPRDAIRYEPGVSIGNQPNRAGAGNYTIRGIGDNRVRLQIDGVKVPDFPGTNIGAGTYTRDFVDLENVKRIEIVRGPASALYGSDAIGGVVGYVTKDPGDYLSLVGKDWYASGKAAYRGADGSFAETVTTAARAGQAEALLLYTRRDGHETEPNGSLSANPQDYFSDNFLGKVVARTSDANLFRLTGEYVRRQTNTDARTDRITTAGAGGGPSTATLDSQGSDKTSRSRISLEHVHDAAIGFIDRTETRIYHTKADRTEHTDQIRSVFFALPATANRLRVSDFGFDQNIFGGEVQLGSKTAVLGLPNSFTYGFSADQTKTSRPRERTERNLTTGTTTNVVAGETFPNKNFPDTATTQAGAYVQDEIEIGRATVIPGLRFDYYHLSPTADAAFTNSNTRNFTIQSQTEFNLSPKLGATYKLTDAYTAFGQYARGFRAPPYDNANFGFTNRTFGYEVLPNGNLKPETSDGIEAGLRGKFRDGSSFSVAGFYNRYSDFIASRVVGTSTDGLQQFQFVNLSNVTIYGAEARGQLRFLSDWSLLGAFAYAHGEDNDTRAAIDAVDPIKMVLGLRYEHPTQGWGSELAATRAWRHSRVSDQSFFKTPGYTTLDLTAFYEIAPTFTINAGLFNLTDEKYFIAQDVTGLAATNANRDLYAQPGRTFGVNATMRW